MYYRIRQTNLRINSVSILYYNDTMYYRIRQTNLRINSVLLDVGLHLLWGGLRESLEDGLSLTEKVQSGLPLS